MTEISDLGKHILATCPKAYVNELGQIIDPCHYWISGVCDPSSWTVGNKPISIDEGK